MPENSSRRRVSSPGKLVYWRDQMDAWLGSGLSLAEYSRRAGISDRALGYWKRRFEREQQFDNAAPLIVAVPIQAVAESATKYRPIIIHASQGFRLEIEGDFHPSVLEKIIRTLSRFS